MKVLQILPELNIGGVERGTLDLSKALVERDHESHVISGGGILVDELTRSGASHYEIPVHVKSFNTLFLAKSLSGLYSLTRMFTTVRPLSATKFFTSCLVLSHSTTLMQ